MIKQRNRINLTKTNEPSRQIFSRLSFKVMQVIIYASQRTSGLQEFQCSNGLSNFLKISLSFQPVIIFHLYISHLILRENKDCIKSTFADDFKVKKN